MPYPSVPGDLDASNGLHLLENVDETWLLSLVEGLVQGLLVFGGLPAVDDHLYPDVLAELLTGSHRWRVNYLLSSYRKS